MLAATVENLAIEFDVEHVMIGFLIDHGSVASYAYWSKGMLRPNFTYSLVGSPCEKVFDTSVCYHHGNVQVDFPEDSMLVEAGVNSYFGMPIRDHRGVVVGIVIVMDSEPINLAWNSLMKLGEAAAVALSLHSPAVAAAS